jgi:hypothetical protein
MVSHRARPTVLATHAVCSALATLLAVAMVVQTARAGSTYRYCMTTQQVMSGRCCPVPAEQAPQRSAVISAWRDCCELRAAPALAPYTSQSHSLVLGSLIGIVVALPPGVAPLGSSEGRAPAVVMRTGPPPARARAQLMVFLI